MRFSPLSLVPLLVLAACTQAGPNDDGSSASSASSSAIAQTNAPLPESNFVENGDNTQGTAYVRGYAEILSEPEPFCEQNCRMFDLVSLRITETNSEGLKKYLGQMGQENPDEYAVTLGCKEGDTIRYANQQGMEMKEYTLNEGTTSAILGATAESPVTLSLYKAPIGGGRGAPACYSHFTNIGVVVSDNMDIRPKIGAGCQVGGCSAEVCGEDTGEPIASNCIFKPEFACYKAAECKKQSDGKCGWTQTPELTACVQKSSETTL
jgi:hypothetical protein